MQNCTNAHQKLPPWLKVRLSGGPNYLVMKALLREVELHTVCEEAHCPNMGQCFGSNIATFLILGNVCARHCRFCAITKGRPQAPDQEEPERVARTVKRLRLRHAVVTSVTRDDLPDGGASLFSATIREIREHNPHCKVEVLIPDFAGSIEALKTVVQASPDVIGHNVETVPRLYAKVRPKAAYARSLELLAQAKQINGSIITKSGLMVGLGESWQEILDVMADLKKQGCDILTLGQYLRPSVSHTPIARYYEPQEFERLRIEGMRMGFSHVESGPLVRSSYHAQQQFAEAQMKIAQTRQFLSHP